MEEELLKINSYIDHPVHGCCKIIDINKEKEYYTILTYEKHTHKLRFTTKVEQRKDDNYVLNYKEIPDEISISVLKVDEYKERFFEPFSIELFNELYYNHSYRNFREKGYILTCSSVFLHEMDVRVNEKYRTVFFCEPRISVSFMFMEKQYYEFLKRKDQEFCEELIKNGITYLNCDENSFKLAVRRKYKKDIL